MRADGYKAAKARNLDIKSHKQVVPNHPEMPDHMQKFVELPLKDFFDNALTLRFRDAVAHFMIGDGGVLDMSGPEYLDSYASVIPISKLCARAAIADHEALLRQVP